MFKVMSVKSLELDVAGHAGAHAQLPHFVAFHLQHRRRQAIEQIVQEHGPSGLPLAVP